MAKNPKKRPTSRGASRGNLGGADHNRTKISAGRKKGFAGGKRPYDYAAYEKEEATPEYLARLFALHNFKVEEDALEKFWQYYCLLRDRNAELDLTRIMGIEATVLKHFIDSAIVARLVPLSGPLLDIGTGPGFPGVPIAICNPGLRVILAESRGKRVTFLTELVKTLSLDNTIIYSRSVREDSPFVPRTDGVLDELAVHDVITRALEVVSPTLQRVSEYVPAGGKVVFMKGPKCGQEVTDAQQEFKGVYKMIQDEKYDLPETNQARRLVVFEKR